jgi:hypothetical protein
MENFLYKFEVIMNDGKTLVNDYPKIEDVGGVICLKFMSNLPLHPIYHFFFAEGDVKLQRFFGRGFIVSAGKKDYCYIILTETHVIYINAYTGAVVYTDKRVYQIKSRFE